MRVSARLVFVLLFVVAAAGAAGAWILSAPQPAFTDANAAALELPGDPVRGRLVFATADCASCHASPARTTACA